MTLTDAQIAKLGAILAAAGGAFVSDNDEFAFTKQMPQIPGVERWIHILMHGEEGPVPKIGGGIVLGFYMGMKLAEAERMEREFTGEVKS